MSAKKTFALAAGFGFILAILGCLLKKPEEKNELIETPEKAKEDEEPC